MKKNKNKNIKLVKKLYCDFVKIYKSQILIAFLLLIIVSVTASAYPYLIQQVFDKLVEKDDAWINIPLIIVVLAIIRGLAMYFQIKQVSKIALKIGIDIQKRLSSHLLFSDVLVINKISSGNHISRIMNDVNLIRDGIERSINNLVRDTLTIFVLVCYLIWLDWLLSIIVIFLYPLALRPIIKIGKKQRIFAKSLQENLEDLTSFLSEIFLSIKTIKSYSLENKEKSRIERSLDSLFDKMFDLVKGRAKVLPILEVLGGLAAGFVIFIAGYRVFSGDLTTGSVIGFVTALLMLSQPARALGTFNTVAQEGLSALERIYQQFDLKPKVEGKTSRNSKTLKLIKGPGIDFKEVSFHFNPEHKVLNNFSLKIKACSKIGIVGDSGSGKSTILNLLSRFFEPTSGKIRINGIDLKSYNLYSLRQAISFVSQDIVIYNDTFYENILLGNLNATKEQVFQAAKLANIYNYIISLPEGFNSVIGESGNTLSGGQKQRVAIARAFIKDAPILLLDEVTSSLDTVTAKAIQKSLNLLSRNKTSLVVTHNINDIVDADKIVLMKNGKILDVSNHKKLLKNSKTYLEFVKN